MELYIDNKRVDTYEDMPVSVSLSVALVSEPEYGRTGYSHSITVPMTPSNRAVLGNCEQVHARERFNSELHTARIESCGALIMEGTIILTGCNCMPGGGGSYTFDIIGSGSEWVRHTSARGISTLFPGWEVVISAATIWDSWTQDDALVRFLPVQRDGYERYNSSPSIMPGERVLTSSDYHPFINVRKVLERLFSEAGYSVRSDFIAGEWFGKLFMSGNYPARDVTVLKKRMDFLASRFGEARATADSFGRVYADPDVDFNTIGNIVDTADPKEESGGVVLEKVYSNGNCFRKEDGQVVFAPLYDISLGFEYRLKYVTDYRIRSATELSGFNIIHLGNDDVRRFKITNRFEDRKNEFCAGKIFRCVVTAGAGDAVYRLVARKIIKAGADPDNLSPGDYETVVIGGFTGATGFVNTMTDGVYTGLSMQYRSGGTYMDYPYEWMLYDGIVDYKGQTEVEITVRSKMELVKASKPKDFSDIYFGGALAGDNFRLLEAEIRPVFLPHPTEGSKVGFAQVAAHAFSRFDLVKALRHMFNLCFFTDHRTKTVYIEPRDDFYTGPVVDWSSRMDTSKPYVLEELGADMPKKLTFRYLAGDGAVARHNTVNADKLGQWSVDINNPYASTMEKVLENPLFGPSVNGEGYVPSAMSASVIQAGDRDMDGDAYSDELNFPPKIVLYEGMESLAPNEKWGWPSYGGSYPGAAFHREGRAGDSLCFGDRDGQVGLRRFWNGNISLYNTGRRLTVWLRLEPCDVEPFVEPDPLMRDFRARFKLRIDGEWSYWRLEEICGYSPYAVSTKCVFVRDWQM